MENQTKTTQTIQTDNPDYSFNKILCIELENHQLYGLKPDKSLGEYPNILLIPITDQFLKNIQDMIQTTKNIFNQYGKNNGLHSLNFINPGFAFATTKKKASEIFILPKDSLIESDEDYEIYYKINTLPFFYESLEEFYTYFSEKNNFFFYPIENTTFEINNLITDDFLITIHADHRFQEKWKIKTKPLDFTKFLLAHKLNWEYTLDYKIR